MITALGGNKTIALGAVGVLLLLGGVVAPAFADSSQSNHKYNNGDSRKDHDDNHKENRNNNDFRDAILKLVRDSLKNSFDFNHMMDAKNY